MEQPSKNGADPNILVGHHQRLDRKMLVQILGLVGFQKVDTVNNGGDVLEALEMHHYDLVIFKNDLPDMNGMEIVGHIDKRWRGKERPIVLAVIGHDARQNTSKLFAAGINDIVYDPPSIETIRAVLSKWV